MSKLLPRVFLKKDHGFSAQTFPLLAFSPVGGREKFLRERGEDSVVFIAGTFSEHTPAAQRGRLLARVTVGHRPVSTVAVLDSLGVKPQHHEFNERGEYRWPDGLPLITAELVNGSPLLKEVVGSNLSGNQWATFAMEVSVAIGDESRRKLLDLPTTPEPLPEIPLLAREATLGRACKSDRQYSTSGPPPTQWAGTAGHTLAWGAAYLLQLKGRTSKLDEMTSIWKVGKATNPITRWKTLNGHLIPVVTGYEWALIRTVDFESELHAFDFEQAVQRRLEAYRVKPEREVFRTTRKVIDEAWSTVLFSGDWALRRV